MNRVGFEVTAVAGGRWLAIVVEAADEQTAVDVAVRAVGPATVVALSRRPVEAAAAPRPGSVLF